MKMSELDFQYGTASSLQTQGLLAETSSSDIQCITRHIQPISIKARSVYGKQAPSIHTARIRSITVIKL